jgi:hypothetical protein
MGAVQELRIACLKYEGDALLCQLIGERQRGNGPQLNVEDSSIQPVVFDKVERLQQCPRRTDDGSARLAQRFLQVERKDHIILDNQDAPATQGGSREAASRKVASAGEMTAL